MPHLTATTNAERVLDWIEENVGLDPDLGVVEQGRDDDRCMRLKMSNGEVVYVTVEQ